MRSHCAHTALTLRSHCVHTALTLRSHCVRSLVASSSFTTPSSSFHHHPHSRPRPPPPSVVVVTMCASVWADTGVFSACGTGQFWDVISRNAVFMWNLKAWGEEPGCALSPEVTWSVSTEFQLYVFTPLL